MPTLPDINNRMMHSFFCFFFFYYLKMEEKSLAFNAYFQFDPCSLKTGHVSCGVVFTADSVPSIQDTE